MAVVSAGTVRCGSDDIVWVVSAIARDDVVRGNSVHWWAKRVCVECQEQQHA